MVSPLTKFLEIVLRWSVFLQTTFAGYRDAVVGRCVLELQRPLNREKCELVSSRWYCHYSNHGFVEGVGMSECLSILESSINSASGFNSIGNLCLWLGLSPRITSQDFTQYDRYDIIHTVGCISQTSENLIILLRDCNVFELFQV
jgi:hypothetical protein